MKFKEFQKKTLEEFLSITQQRMPEFYAQIEQEIKDRPPWMTNLATIELELAHRIDQFVFTQMSQWMLKAAAKAPDICPTCETPLEQITRGMEREVVLKTGKFKMPRAVGWCSRCNQWRCPADAVLKLPELTDHSPSAENRTMPAEG